MRKELVKMVLLPLVVLVCFCACGTTPQNPENTTATDLIASTEPKEETEPEIEVDPYWLSESAIDDAVSCLFPLEGEIDVELAQEILLPLVEAGNAEAQYYWGYIYDYVINDNTGEEEKESLYWYELSLQKGFPKAYLAASQNIHIGSNEKKMN